MGNRAGTASLRALLSVLTGVSHGKLASRGVNKHWHRVLHWRGKMRPPSHVLEVQATSLKNAVLGSEEYRQFKF